jgi:hypothetical protein
MEIFISWAGERSRGVAEALWDWLPKVIQSLRPWISNMDIDKGARWIQELSGRLSNCNFGLIVLNAKNMNAPWLLFEAGALSKALDSSRVCPILMDLDSSSVIGPLSQFQATKLEKGDIFKLIKDINKELDTKALADSQLQESFETWWPKFEEKLNSIPAETEPKVVKQSERDLLQEVLRSVRAIERQLTSDEPMLISEFTQRMLARLTPREELTLRLLYGIGGELATYEQIAERFQLTPQEVRRIEAKGLRKFRNRTMARIFPSEDKEKI